MPDLKPSLKLAEPVLEEMDYEDDEDIAPSTTEQQQPEDTRDVKIQRTVLQVGYNSLFMVLIERGRKGGREREMVGRERE